MRSRNAENKKTLQCLVADGGRTLFSGETTDVVLPGIGAIVEVLPGHAESFIALGEGEVVIAVGEDEEEAYRTVGGVAHVRDGRLVVLL